jgi:uncharacterized protein YutD
VRDGKMEKFIDGEEFTLDVISEIVDQFDWNSDQYKNEAFDKTNNAILPGKNDVEEMMEIAKEYNEMGCSEFALVD